MLLSDSVFENVFMIRLDNIDLRQLPSNITKKRSLNTVPTLWGDRVKLPRSTTNVHNV